MKSYDNLLIQNQTQGWVSSVDNHTFPYLMLFHSAPSINSFPFRPFYVPHKRYIQERFYYYFWLYFLGVSFDIFISFVTVMVSNAIWLTRWKIIWGKEAQRRLTLRKMVKKYIYHFLCGTIDRYNRSWIILVLVVVYQGFI